MHEKLCTAGLSESFARKGYLMTVGLAGPYDFSAGTALMETACTKGAGFACNEMGVLMKNDSGSTRYFQRSCDLGFALACSNLARNYFHGTGAAKDVNRAYAMWESLCAERELDACKSMTFEANQIGDFDRAVRVAKLGCSKGESESCFWVGKDLLRYRQPWEAIRYFRTACAGGYAMV